METLVTQAAALKEYYAPNVCQILYFKNNPAFAMIAKDKTWGGKSTLRIPFVWGTGAGISTSFTRAQANGLATAASISEVLVYRAKTHAVGFIDNETIRATRDDMKAFVKGSKLVTDTCVTNLGRDLEISFFRAGYGDRGRLSATQTLTSATVTLATPSDAFNFEVGQRIDLTAAVGSTAAVKAYGTAGNPLHIIATDTDAGTITLNAALNDAADGVPTVAVSDYIMIQGDVGTSSTNSYRPKPCGLLGWCPDAAPSSGESFYGLDRSVSNRLYGQRIDMTTAANNGISYVEAINKGVGKIASFGGQPSHGFCSWETYEEVVNSLESKREYIEREVFPGIGFRGIQIITNRGNVELYPSVGCDSNHLWLVDLGQISLYSLDEAITISDEDGFEMVRSATSDTCEVRYKSMGNYGCRNPGGAICNIKVR